MTAPSSPSVQECSTVFTRAGDVSWEHEAGEVVVYVYGHHQRLRLSREAALRMAHQIAVCAQATEEDLAKRGFPADFAGRGADHVESLLAEP